MAVGPLAVAGPVVPALQRGVRGNKYKEAEMNRFVLSLMLVGALLVTTVSVALAAATTSTESVKVPLNGLVLPNPCSGEPVALSGTLHTVVHITIDAQGGERFFVQSGQQQVTGVGLTSGTRYQATGVTREAGNDTAGEAVEGTFVNTFKIISQGDADNYFVANATIHLTYANGEFRAEVVNVSTECQG